MFCDLVGYTEISHRLDPEDLREILTSYQHACVRSVHQFDGYVAQYLGDGLLVYFGFPRAREDAAERALRAALAIRSSLAAMNQQRQQSGAEAIAARIGIHTGLVLVTEIGDAAHPETLALGDTINIAARLQSLAGPGEIYASHATLRLTPGSFLTRDLGTPQLKGVADPVGVHAVERTARVAPRFRMMRALTPLAGRDQELSQLMQCWEQLPEGRGQVVFISGEPGIGKSRLVHTFGERIANEPHFSIDLGCSPFATGSAFQPFVELLERGLAFSEGDSPETRLEKLEARLGAIQGLALPEVIPYLTVLLGLPESPRHPLVHMGPDLQRERTLQAILAPIAALAASQPLLLTCEDLHWSDPSTLELLGRLIDEAPTQQILLILTFRSEFQPPWPLRSTVSWIRLQRLTRPNTLAIVRARVDSAHPVPDALAEALAERADGVPLFAEELARSVLESSPSIHTGTRGPPPLRPHHLQIPSSLQDSLMARLDRLPAGKRVAQVAATLGRTFGYPLIEAVVDIESEMLLRGLAQLVDAEILFQSGAPPHSTYTFKHALLQDTAYESQLTSFRRQLHGRISAVLRDRFPQRVAAEPEEIARHSAAGGLQSEAVDYYRQAGEQAVTRIAYAEAYDYFARALELLAELPEDRDRDVREIELRMSQAAPLGALRGYEDPELLASIARTEHLSERIGSGPQQIPGLVKLMLFHTHALPRAREYARSLLTIVEPLGIAPLCVAGYMIRGTGALTSATISDACHDLNRALEIAETTDLPSPKAAFEVDATAMACCTYAMALVLSGKPDTAAKFIERGVQRARALAHPRTLASALQNSATAFCLMDEPKRSGDLSDQCLEAIAGHGFHEVEVSARVLSGWARARRGDPEAIVGMDEALRYAEERGVVAGMTQLYFRSAEIHALGGRNARALEQLERGEAFIRRAGEEFGFEPLAILARARILLATPSPDLQAVESLLLRGFELSQRNQAPWLAIDAATLLGRIACDAGKGAAHALERLRQLYSEFTEGFSTTRLRDAHNMIERLVAA